MWSSAKIGDANWESSKLGGAKLAGLSLKFGRFKNEPVKMEPK